MWHASSRSGVATLRTAIHLLLTYTAVAVVTNKHDCDEHDIVWGCVGVRIRTLSESHNFTQIRNPTGLQTHLRGMRIYRSLHKGLIHHSLLSVSVRENVYNNSKKRKVMFFRNLKKNVKNVGLPPTYSFTGRSITQPLILNYRNGNSVPVPVSHQHHTPCSEMRTQETSMQLTCRSAIVKRL